MTCLAASLTLGSLVVAAGAVTTAVLAAGDPSRGAAVFDRSGCGVCHTFAAAKASGKIGPSLDARRPTAERVTTIVTAGSGTMPAFRGHLSAAEIDDLAAFVAAPAGGQTPVAPPTSPAAPARPASPAAPAAPREPRAGGQPSLDGTTVRVRLSDSTMRVLPPRVTAGPVRIVATNTSARLHTLVLLRSSLPANALPVRKGRVVEIGRQTRLRVPPRATRRTQVTLRPGWYALVSARRGAYARGVFGALQTTAATPAPAAIPAAAPAAPPATPPAAPTPADAQPPPAQVPTDGRSLFTAVCGGCHTLSAAGTSGTVGPDLDDEHPDAGRVAKVVRRGDDEMPAFGDSLSPAQIEAIASFVASATRGSRGGDRD